MKMTKQNVKKCTVLKLRANFNLWLHIPGTRPKIQRIVWDESSTSGSAVSPPPPLQASQPIQAVVGGQTMPLMPASTQQQPATQPHRRQPGLNTRGGPGSQRPSSFQARPSRTGMSRGMTRGMIRGIRQQGQFPHRGTRSRTGLKRGVYRGGPHQQF